MRINITQMALSFIAGFGLLAGTAVAQITADIDANIPFSFTVGNQTLAAGKYLIHPLDIGELEIQAQNGKAVAIETTEQAQANTEPKDTELIFRRYGDHEFLDKVFLAGDPYGVELARSKMERRLMAQGQKATEHHQPAKAHARVPKVS